MDNSFYTYAYLREDGTPYYIGKGSGNRAFCKKGRPCSTPPKSRILFLKKNLTEAEAFRHEIYMIAILGRKDLGTGILWNRSDGGQGVSGLVFSSETKRKMSLAKLGKKRGPLSKDHKKNISLALTGRSHSLETKVKIKKARERQTFSESTGEKLSEAGKKRKASPETRAKLSRRRGEFSPTSLWWRLTFCDGTVVTVCSLNAWAKDNGYHVGNLHKLKNGRGKKCKDIVSVECLREE